MIDRIDYLFEVRRNQKKIRSKLSNNKIIDKIIDNSSLLLLLNYFSVQESLVIATNLDVLNVTEEDLQQVYTFNEDDFRRLFDSINISYIKDLLAKRIEKLKGIELETSFLDYEKLIEDYEDLLNRIDDTQKYFYSTKKR